MIGEHAMKGVKMRKLNWYLPSVMALAMLFAGAAATRLSAQDTQEKLSLNN
jgi:hypothetical protein